MITTRYKQGGRIPLHGLGRIRPHHPLPTCGCCSSLAKRGISTWPGRIRASPTPFLVVAQYKQDGITSHGLKLNHLNPLLMAKFTRSKPPRIFRVTSPQKQHLRRTSHRDTIHFVLSVLTNIRLLENRSRFHTFLLVTNSFSPSLY